MSRRKRLHREYLKSEHWSALRASAMNRDGFKCVECGGKDRLQGHHKLYRDKLEDGVLDDIVTLCRACHREAHGLSSYSQFDYLIRELKHQLGLAQTIPTPDQEIRLVSLITDDMQRDEVKALFRWIAASRIRRNLWDAWIAKPAEVTGRLWPWATHKLNRIQNQLTTT